MGLSPNSGARSSALEEHAHCSFGILLWSVATGLIRDKALAFHLLDYLANSSFWISRRVLQKAKRALDALFE